MRVVVVNLYVIRQLCIKKSILNIYSKQETLATLDLAVACASDMASTRQARDKTTTIYILFTMVALYD